MEKKNNQGFASMNSSEVKRIATLGGKKVSENRAWMAEIGRKGAMRSVETRRKNMIKKQSDGQESNAGHEGQGTKGATLATGETPKTAG